jgi:hypothetical protein
MIILFFAFVLCAIPLSAQQEERSSFIESSLLKNKLTAAAPGGTKEEAYASALGFLTIVIDEKSSREDLNRSPEVERTYGNVTVRARTNSFEKSVSPDSSNFSESFICTIVFRSGTRQLLWKVHLDRKRSLLKKNNILRTETTAAGNASFVTPDGSFADLEKELERQGFKAYYLKTGNGWLAQLTYPLPQQ